MKLRLAIVILISIFGGWFAPLARAQANTGSVCVLVYLDSDRNGFRASGEDVLANVNVNLMLTPNIIVANHVTTGSEPFCFTNLPPQQYMVSINSPTYAPVSTAPVAFALTAGERITREFGAVASAPDTTPLPEETIITIPLNTPVRLGLSGLCALGAMAVLGAIGMFFYGLFFFRRRSQAVDPHQETAS